LADQHRDGVLEDAALQFRIDLLRLTVEQLGLGAYDIGFCGDTEAIRLS